MGKWITCKNCGHEYHNDLKECPQCYRKTPLTLKRFLIYGIVSLFFCSFVTGIVLLAASDEAFKNDLNTDSQTVSSDTVNDNSADESSTSDEVSTELEDSKYDQQQSSDMDESSSTISVSKPVANSNQDVSSDNSSSVIEYIEFTLPEQLDTERVIKSLSSTYFPLNIISLNSAFRASQYFQSYTRELENNHMYLRMTSKLPRCVIYQYEVRGQVEDMQAAQKLCEKYFNENSEYFKAQYDIIKKYVKDTESLAVCFYFLNHNEYVTSKEIK